MLVIFKLGYTLFFLLLLFFFHGVIFGSILSSLNITPVNFHSVSLVLHLLQCPIFFFNHLKNDWKEVEVKWTVNDIKEIHDTKGNKRLAFQRKGAYIRGLTITKEAFDKMEDVTISAGMRIELQPNVCLTMIWILR